ncbi:hypothetical protein TREES_T100007248 [Tupaia chinensis]|uniref:Uncharacterized protein n=1 Tax=Tupaia chinensis TaxID=246437 RepID=L9L187_TUPCH|nr:hypothetical protein TREES_T100007248 [Tupaia chinensis]
MRWKHRELHPHEVANVTCECRPWDDYAADGHTHTPTLAPDCLSHKADIRQLACGTQFSTQHEIPGVPRYPQDASSSLQHVGQPQTRLSAETVSHVVPRSSTAVLAAWWDSTANSALSSLETIPSTFDSVLPSACLAQSNLSAFTVENNTDSENDEPPFNLTLHAHTLTLQPCEAAGVMYLSQECSVHLLRTAQGSPSRSDTAVLFMACLMKVLRICKAKGHNDS